MFGENDTTLTSLSSMHGKRCLNIHKLINQSIKTARPEVPLPQCVNMCVNADPNQPSPSVILETKTGTLSQTKFSEASPSCFIS